MHIHIKTYFKRSVPYKVPSLLYLMPAPANTVSAGVFIQLPGANPTVAIYVTTTKSEKLRAQSPHRTMLQQQQMLPMGFCSEHMARQKENPNTETNF